MAAVADIPAAALEVSAKNMDTCAAPVKEKYERLPTFAVPEHYDLKIMPDMQTYVFSSFLLFASVFEG